MELPWLDLVEQIAVIVTALTVVIALIQYADAKSRDAISSCIDQVAFFREKILGKQNEFTAHMTDASKGGSENFAFLRLPLPNPATLDNLIKTQPELSRQQLETALKDRDTLNFHTNILNMVEEFSLRVKYSYTHDNPALTSLRSAFVELVEIHGTYLLFVRDVSTGNKVYSSILELYKEWNTPDLDKRPIKERLEEYLEKRNK